MQINPSKSVIIKTSHNPERESSLTPFSPRSSQHHLTANKLHQLTNITATSFQQAHHHPSKPIFIIPVNPSLSFQRTIILAKSSSSFQLIHHLTTRSTNPLLRWNGSIIKRSPSSSDSLNHPLNLTAFATPFFPPSTFFSLSLSLTTQIWLIQIISEPKKNCDTKIG